MKRSIPFSAAATLLTVVSLAACTDQAQPTAPKATAVAVVAPPVVVHSGSSICRAYLNRQSLTQQHLGSARQAHAAAAIVNHLKSNADKLASMSAEACN